MMSLLPYRPWNFNDGDASQISALTEPERKADDRSPFVRYARSAALWAEWVREDVVVLDPEVQTPTEQIGAYTFRVGVVPIESLTPLMSVPPKAKDHQQRLLESTQLYVEPIIVESTDSEGFLVVGNHELFAAASAYQMELARPNKRKASDYCLVAIVDESYWSTVQIEPLTFWVSKTAESISDGLIVAGYAVSPRTDDPGSIRLEVDGQILTKPFDGGDNWKDDLSQIFGTRSLDQGSIDSSSNLSADKVKVILRSPNPRSSVKKTSIEFPYGSLVSTIKPLQGANMWSLKDFRVE